MTATYLRALAVRFKHPAFEAENEWRLITHDLLVDGKLVKGGIDLQTFYRAVFGRARPYKEFAPTLVQLLEGADCAGLPMERSNIPVRL